MDPLIKKNMPQKKQPATKKSTNDEQNPRIITEESCSVAKMENPCHGMETEEKRFSHRKRGATTTGK